VSWLHGLRAVYEVPAAKGFTVGDITINGLPINALPLGVKHMRELHHACQAIAEAAQRYSRRLPR
jgi:hypothetical protein